MTDLKNEFWDRIEDVRTAMLGVKGQGRLVAMSPRVDDDMPGHVWFITAKGTDLAKATANGPCDARLVVSSDSEGLYADVDGKLTHSTDREALDETWSFVADAWFEGGKADPDVHLLRFTPRQAEVSVTATNSLNFFYEMAKAKLADEKPNLGAQGLVTF
ncbi:general stress protein [Pseudorhodobacter turbinis]|uniref:General stress protein n=1 Tax=Pseudorhodobacter turbinis TaxID=2500533 RepID=A0A4P8EFY8_9RHOB|nr:pyridoxamine 5'-phosphate oxidase family protein [Pseudorhodobacter turbinis]QCO55613.1 general stress protein [Pseudorhodobacter turbinis]